MCAAGPTSFRLADPRSLSRATMRAVSAKLGDLMRKGKVEMALVPGDVSNDSGWYYDYLHSVMPIFNNVCGAVPCYGIHGNHDAETVFDRYATSGRLCCAKNGLCAQTLGNQWPCANAFNVLSRPLCNARDFGTYPVTLTCGPSLRPLFESLPLLSHGVQYDLQSQAISDRRPSSLLTGTLKQHSYYAFRWGGVGFAVMDMPDTVWGRYKCENRDPTLNNGCAPGDAEPLGAMGWGAHTRAPDVESAQARFLRDADAWLPRDVRILVTHGYISGAEAWDTPSGQPYRDNKYLALDANALGFDISLAGHGDEGVGYEWLTELGEPELAITDESTASGWIMPFSSAAFVAREVGEHRPGYATHKTERGVVVSAQWKARARPERLDSYCAGGFVCAECLTGLRTQSADPSRRQHAVEVVGAPGCGGADKICLEGGEEACP